MKPARDLPAMLWLARGAGYLYLPDRRRYDSARQLWRRWCCERGRLHVVVQRLGSRMSELYAESFAAPIPEHWRKQVLILWHTHGRRTAVVGPDLARLRLPHAHALEAAQVLVRETV